MRLVFPSLKLIQWLHLSALLLVLLPLGQALYLSKMYAEELHERDMGSIERRLNSTLYLVNERVERVKAMLETLVQSDTALKGDWQGLYDQALRLVQHDKLITVITLVDADTRIVFGTLVPFDSEHPMAAQPEDDLRVLTTGEPALSSPFLPPFKAANVKQRWIVSIGVPLRVNGKVTHVLRGILPCDSLRDVLVELKFPQGWLATITDRHGLLIARNFSHDETVGKLVIPPMVEAIQSHRSGVFSVRSREGTTYLGQVGFLPGGDWSVQVGVSEILLAVASQDAIQRISIFYALVVVAIVLLGWFIASRLARSLGAMISIAKAVTQHRPVQRLETGIKELDELQVEFEALSTGQQQLLEESRNQASLLRHMNTALEQRVAERTEELLETSKKIDAERQRFLKMLDTMPVIIDIIRADRRIEWTNRAYREALGDNTEKLCYLSQFGREAPCAECQAFVPFQTGQPHHWEWTFPTGRTYDIYNFPFLAADGSPAILEMDINITEERQNRAKLLALNETLEERVAERTAKLSEARTTLEAINKRFRLAMEAAAEGIWDWNLDTGEVYYSPGYASMLGYAPQDLKPHVSTWTSLMHPDEVEAITREANLRLQDPGHYALEFRMRRQDGRYGWVLSRGQVVERQLNGEPSRAIGTHVDITELKEARLKAEAANLAKSAFLANMSHEIRTPLNGIMGLAHIIRNGGLTARQLDQMNRLETAGRHLLDILNAILDLSKVEAGKLEIIEQPFDATALMEELGSIMREEMDRKGLQLRLEAVSLPSGLLGDGLRIRQAYLNLFGNAVKFTDQGVVTLRISTLEEDESSALIKFAVEDTGIGIAAEVLPRLFTDFEQADKSLTRKYGGTGLGLALVHRLACLMGGDAGASSTLGVGSLFWFTARLNKVATSPDPRVQSILPEEVLRILKTEFPGRRVLVVEDDVINRMVAEFLLTDAGLEVEIAEDGLQAVKMFQIHPYDLILMDMHLPNMDGLEATREIRTQLSSDVPIIAVTADAFEQDQQQCLAAGMNDYLSKPVDPDVLYATILRCFDRSRDRRLLTSP